MGIKGIILTLDSALALLIMISVVSVLIFFRIENTSPFFQSQILHSLSEDALTVLSESTLREVVTNKTMLDEYNQSGILNSADYDKKAIDVIGALYSVNDSAYSAAAKNITKDILEDFLPSNVGYQILINYDDVYNSSGSNRTNYSDATAEISSARIASGYEKGKNVSGCVAMAYLTNVKGRKDSYIYFGGYVGDGNITVNVSLPSSFNITEVYMEMNDGTNFSLFINNLYSGDYINGTAGGGLMRADNWTVCNSTYQDSYCRNFVPGNNIIKINFTEKSLNNSYIGGGYIKVSYNTTVLTPEEEYGNSTYWFPGIVGFFNLYDSVYFPGSLVNISTYLHYYNNISLNETNSSIYFKIGDVKIYNSTDAGEKKINLSLDNFSQNFVTLQNLVNNVSNKTVPLRFGVEGFEIKPGVGKADAVLVTDVSGSMVTKDVQCSLGWQISSTSQQGSYGAQNQQINNSQAACIYRNVTLTSPGRIYFYWRVSSESGGDYLEFYINGSEQQSISGSVSWTSRNFYLNSGVQEIKWCYNKDDSAVGGNDAGYIDSIVVNTTGTVFFSDNFESGTLDGWNFTGLCKRINVAKDVDKAFVNAVLGTSGDRVGLVSYSSTVSSTHPLSNNTQALIGNISQYTEGGSTCTSCGISSATQMLDAVAEIRFKGLLVMSDGVANQCLNGNDCGIYGGPVSGSYNGLDPLYPAKLEAINKSCEARSKNYTVFSVAFGSGSDGLTLQRIACWNCSVCQIGLKCNQFYFQPTCEVNPECLWNSTALSNKSLLIDGFETDITTNWTVSANWARATDREHSGSYSAKKSQGSVDGNLTSKGINTSDATDVYVDFWYRDDDTDANEVTLEFNNSNGVWSSIADLSSSTEDFWWRYTLRITDPQYFHLGFAIRFRASTFNNVVGDQENFWIDDVNIIKTVIGECQNNFSLNSPCWVGNVLLPNGTEAACTAVRYAKSNNVDELKSIYEGFGQWFMKLGYTSQKTNIGGILKTSNILYPDSYIRFEYSPLTPPYEYGEISLTEETLRFGDLTKSDTVSIPYKEGWFNVSDKVILEDVRVSSYSSDYWTDLLLINSSATGDWKEAYNLSYYGNDYTVLGDPFIVHIPLSKVSSGNNSIRVETGTGTNFTVGSSDRKGGSPHDRIFYIIRVKGSVGYGSLYQTCTEASADAVQRLNEIIGGFLDLLGNEVQVQKNSISTVPYMWGPASVRVRVWS